ncbi:15627_t:CDS:2 [Cetraspora pellucida]|uniref:15627_t:CDS:1 n=1 Tax=Cetraspora pellucida TaxID=1433469 RepID=A0A9N9EM09_9GLOM|nr:15627_t:CDS:2 [Cetraspora pellucida]
MNEAVLYNGKKVALDNLYNLTLDTVENGPIEVEYDLCQIRFEKLLERIDHSLIAEVWEVHSIENKLNIGQHIVLLKNGFHLCTCILLFDSEIVCYHWFYVILQSEKGLFHISLIPNYWYKDDVDSLVNNKPFVKAKLNKHDDSTSNTLSIPSFSAVEESWNTIFIEPPEQAAAKVIVDYDDPNDSDVLMKMFKKWIYKHEEVQCSKKINQLQNTEDDQASKYEQVDNEVLECDLAMEDD